MILFETTIGHMGFIKPTRISILILLAFALIGASLFVFAHTCGEVVLSWEQVPIRAIQPESGFCYQAPLGRTWMSSHGKPSPARILEDGKPLGSPNSQHEDIRKKGQGRFSFWHDHLYFSTSNNSDPRTNGKKYEILWPVPLHPGISKGLYGVTFFVFFLTLYLIFQIIREEMSTAVGNTFRERWKRTIEREGSFSSSVSMLMRALGFVFILCFIYFLLYRPFAVVTYAYLFFAYASALVVCVLLGYHLARFFAVKKKEIFRGSIRGALFFAFIGFLLSKPEISKDFNGFKNLFPFLAAMVLMGGSLYFFEGRLQRRFSSWLTPIYEGEIPILFFIIPLVIALPGVVKPLTTLWDMSGYMDSHMYDFDAHNIATWTAPQGNGFVMPLYQYGMALFYFIFGHFFYVQQVINVLMALLSILLLSLCAWNLFRTPASILLAGVMTAFTAQMHTFVHITQIENWYLPLISLTLFAWSCYWRNPRASHLVFLAVSIGLAFNCRTQGAFFYFLLGLTPFFIGGLPMKKRVFHFFGVGIVVLATLLPWSLRNYIYEQRFSPFSTQGEISLVLNDHRIVFYGLREDNWVKYLEEYYKKYPDKDERQKVMKEDFIKNTFGDPIWLAKALFWRGIAYYSLLPPGVWALNGPEPTDWKQHWSGYIYLGYSSFFFIVTAVLGIILRPGRTTFFLALAILSQVILIVAIPLVDRRYGFPVIPIHIILSLFAFLKPVADNQYSGREIEAFSLFSSRRIRWMSVAILCLGVFMAFCYYSLGNKYLYRPLMEKAIVFDNQISIDERLPSLNEYYWWRKEKIKDAPIFSSGDRVKIKCKVTNYMLPPKSAGMVSYLPVFVSDPLRETYYYANPLNDSPGYIGISYFGATANTLIKENDHVEVEGTILYVDAENKISVWFWVKAEKIRWIKSADPRT